MFNSATIRIITYFKKLSVWSIVGFLLNVTLDHFNTAMNIVVLTTPCFSYTGVQEIKRQFMFEKNQFFVIEMESPLEKDQYVTTLEFSGAYVDDMRGMYKASFKYKNGTES